MRKSPYCDLTADLASTYWPGFSVGYSAYDGTIPARGLFGSHLQTRVPKKPPNWLPHGKTAHQAPAARTVMPRRLDKGTPTVLKRRSNGALVNQRSARGVDGNLASVVTDIKTKYVGAKL